MSQGKQSFGDRVFGAVKKIGAKIKGVFVKKKVDAVDRKLFREKEPTVIIDPSTGAARPIARDMTRRQYIWREMKKNKVAYMMVGPFLILFFIFTILPVFLSMILSLTDFNMLQMPHFKGLANFQRLILDDEGARRDRGTDPPPVGDRQLSRQLHYRTVHQLRFP